MNAGRPQVLSEDSCHEHDVDKQPQKSPSTSFRTMFHCIQWGPLSGQPVEDVSLNKSGHKPHSLSSTDIRAMQLQGKGTDIPLL